MTVRVLTWNLHHGQDRPPNPALFTWRSRLLRISERDATHVQVNRDLYSEFASILVAADWDVVLLQESPPRWAAALARDCDADSHLVLTARNSLPWLRSALARRNPDLIRANEGGSNLTLVRHRAIAERREVELRSSPLRRLRLQPERRTMSLTRADSGLCVANLHASHDPVAWPEHDLAVAAAAATDWAGDAPLILGGDFNLSPETSPHTFSRLEQDHGLRFPTPGDAIDHVLARGLTPRKAPARWPEEKRELRCDGLALRPSDHTPVEAVYAM